MNPFPYMPLYWNDLLSDNKVRAMRDEELGTYLRLLGAAWQEDRPGTLPADYTILARLAGLATPVWKKRAAAVLACFSLEADRYVQKRMVEEFQKLVERSDRRRDAGHKGGVAKASKQTPGNAIALPEQSYSEALAKGVALTKQNLGSQSQSQSQREDPPNPQPKAAGGEEASHEAELPKPELWNRVCAVVGRDPAKAKSHLEMCALSEASGITEDDMQIVERFAAAERKKPQQERKGKWLAHTLLAEFHAEVGKARMALDLTSPHPSRPDPRAGIDPAAFLSWLRQNFPFGRQDITLETADADLITEYGRDTQQS